MAIEVRCPNGHRLKCPEDRAGMRGKCPKCGATFQVPANGQATAGSAIGRGETSQVTAPSESGKMRIRDAAADEKISFLCPNGHKLSGPLSLQGQPGQCPHCRAKFLIPHLDVDDDEQLIAQQDPLADPFDDAAEGEPLEDEFLGLDELEEVEHASGSRRSGPAVEPGLLPGMPEGLLPDAAPDEFEHPLATLFVTLWQEHEHGAAVEIHMANGVTIVPDWWAPALSVHAYGVFAIQTPDGSYVMEAVAWDAVQRITIRRIQELPGGIFE